MKAVYLVLYLYKLAYPSGGPALQLLPLPSLAICEDVGRQVRARLASAGVEASSWCIETAAPPTPAPRGAHG